jgi:hypothetical protein
MARKRRIRQPALLLTVSAALSAMASPCARAATSVPATSRAPAARASRVVAPAPGVAPSAAFASRAPAARARAARARAAGTRAAGTRAAGTVSTTAPPPTAAASSAATTTTATNPEMPVPVEASEEPPVGRFLSADRVLEIAGRLPKMRKVRAEYPGSYGGAYLKGPTNWQVSYFSRQGKEIGQVIVADHTGRVLEQWTGFQIAWTMARGYRGAFGRHVNALYVWIPLCVLFFAPFFDWRRPVRLLHVDLLVLLSFSVSLAFFNHGRIYVSTPAAYPPLLYLLARMLAVARVRLRRRASTLERMLAVAPVRLRRRASTDRTAGAASPNGALPPADQASLQGPMSAAAGPVPPRERPVRLLVPPHWLALALVFLIGFRIALNVTDANVIDVGYASVIGAQRVVDGSSLYGGYPADNEHGDTYGPVSYEAYVPFEQALGFSGRWDDLPAARAAAIFFDLLAIALLFLLGRRVRGPSLGIALAYAWASYPFTLFTLESNSNDTLVAVLVLAALLVASSPPARGVFAALAGLVKFAPLALAPLLCTHGLRGSGLSSRARRAKARPASAVLLFCAAFAVTAAAAALPALAYDSLHTIYERTLVYQSHRESPFSIWGLYGTSPTGGPYAHWLAPVQVAVEIAAVAFAVALALLPRRGDLVGLAAAAAAILIAVQLGIDHWFYLYIPWFFGLAMLALLGELSWAPQPRRLTSARAGRRRSARRGLSRVWPRAFPAAPAPAGPGQRAAA